MTPTIQLDPDALEAAEYATQFTCGGRSIADSAYWNVLTFTAITAYIAAIEPQLRERVRVFELECKASGYGIGGDVENTRAALFALLGLGPSE